MNTQQQLLMPEEQAILHDALYYMKIAESKKDDWLYLDKMHKDHIEVFTKSGKDLRTILNMDGTQNLNKIAQTRGMRDILEWIR